MHRRLETRNCAGGSQFRIQTLQPFRNGRRPIRPSECPSHVHISVLTCFCPDVRHGNTDGHVPVVDQTPMIRQSARHDSSHYQPLRPRPPIKDRIS